MKHMGKALKQIIEKNHLEKKKVAGLAGLHPSRLSQLFDNETLDVVLLDKLCKILNVSPLYFFDDNMQETAIVRDITQTSYFGDSNVAINDKTLSVYKDLIESKDKLLEEKERYIQLLTKTIEGYQTGLTSDSKQ